MKEKFASLLNRIDYSVKSYAELKIGTHFKQEYQALFEFTNITIHELEKENRDGKLDTIIKDLNWRRSNLERTIREFGKNAGDSRQNGTMKQSQSPGTSRVISEANNGVGAKEDHVKDSQEFESEKNRIIKELQEESNIDASGFEMYLPGEIKENFDIYVGMEGVKNILKENYIWPEKYPDLAKKWKIQPLKGFLFFGPPGCGKTFFVKCIAGEFKKALVLGDSASIMRMYVGKSPERVKALFALAKKMKPCILFIDETDKILPREMANSEVKGDVKNTFLIELNSRDKDIMVFFATNEPENIDEALFRPGRIELKGVLYIEPPKHDAIKKMIQISLKYDNKEPIPTEVTPDEIVDLFKGDNSKGVYSTAAIEAIVMDVREQGMRKDVESREEKSDDKSETSVITKDMFLTAIESSPFDISPHMLEKYKSFADKRGAKIT
jgi:SpoVK/Ycf46/Vps4 family AAA+-type ATPase